MKANSMTAAVAAILVLAACNRDGVIEQPVGEGYEHYRPVTSSSSAQATRVFEYRPAPGQFINETQLGGFDGSETTPAAAAAYAERRMRELNYVSLGAFGGYIVVGFDHSIDNRGGYDLAILGNAFDTNSEPGVVYVMRDENGNGLPDDTWYELRGSEYGKPETLHDYSVTYFRPDGEQQPVRWRDSFGEEGEIDFIRLHNQPSYYPAWIAEDSYTLTGVRLAPRTHEEEGRWVRAPYDWGYADNFSPTDRMTDDDNPQAAAAPNHFKISNAVTADGRAANLKFIDFVKVQSAVNAKSGGLGEYSTEVIGFTDCNMTNR